MKEGRRARRAGRVLLAALFVLGVLQVRRTRAHVSELQGATEGVAAPNFRAARGKDSQAGSDSREFDLDALRGKVVVLDFFAIWCAPCKAAMPQLQELHDTFEGEVEIVSIQIDADEDQDEVASYLSQHLPAAQWVVDRNASATMKYGVTTIPHLVVIDRRGTIDKVVRGYQPATLLGDLTDAIGPLLKRANSDQEPL